MMDFPSSHTRIQIATRDGYVCPACEGLQVTLVYKLQQQYCTKSDSCTDYYVHINLLECINRLTEAKSYAHFLDLRT